MFQKVLALLYCIEEDSKTRRDVEHSLIAHITEYMYVISQSHPTVRNVL